MKTSSALCALIVALTLTTNGAFAVASLNTSRSNIYKIINPKDQNAVSACTKAGGKVGKDPKGRPACVTQAPETRK